jgi:hypothetical protein
MFYRFEGNVVDICIVRCRLFVELLLLLFGCMYEIQVYTDAECPNQ